MTKIISYFIPHCNDAVEFAFGTATHFFPFDAISRYPQIPMEKSSHPKTTFAKPHSRKYIFNVMPYGLVNNPTSYTVMIYDLQEIGIMRPLQNLI